MPNNDVRLSKAQARNKAIDYLWNAGSAFSDMCCKIAIDDKGTLSDDGYVDEDLEKIQKELDYLLTKLYKYTLGKTIKID